MQGSSFRKRGRSAMELHWYARQLLWGRIDLFEHSKDQISKHWSFFLLLQLQQRLGGNLRSSDVEEAIDGMIRDPSELRPLQDSPLSSVRFKTKGSPRVRSGVGEGQGARSGAVVGCGGHQ
ncbi:hypothetical protein L484_020543 [Morus notabilis]|uniref:Uncharacterized protein n=1 Tax=Morus notabilis TaxID=981085 RepID=W9S0N3_9ROSA|nr:hypothetical protein L484_020543 [Morus notabilis]